MSAEAELLSTKNYIVSKMSKTEMHLTLIAALLMLAAARSKAAEMEWGYPDLDAGEEFNKWGGMCDAGKQQSPIHLSLGIAVMTIHALPFTFANYDTRHSNISMVNNGHTVELSNFAKAPNVKGGPLHSGYVVEELHLHWPSEHTLNKIRYPLEVHVVHRNMKYANKATAAQYEDGIAVLGILYHASSTANEGLQPIIENLNKIQSYEQLNKPYHIKDTFSIHKLFPHFDAYLSYRGSLTTPSCAEAVTWVVLKDTFPVTIEQVNQFKQIEYAKNKRLKNNYRNIQPSHMRPVLFCRNSHNSAAGIQFPTTIAALLLSAGITKLLHSF